MKFALAVCTTTEKANNMQCGCFNFCSSNHFPSVLVHSPHRFSDPFRTQFLSNSLLTSACSTQFPLTSLHFRHGSPKVHCAGTDISVERPRTQPRFIETGYVYSVHGLQGELRVKPNTDFPELRFSQPGRRWLRQEVSGREVIQEIDLIEGRGHAGQHSWLVRFDGIDCVDKALKLVGSTILVSEKDRPELEEGEFYSQDLVGMTVILKETGEKVGTVVSVFNTGANDLLRVELSSSFHMSDGPGMSKEETSDSGPRVWVPFVEAIVPDVDLINKVMLITPPKGLLELNIRSDDTSKKERRQLEWKERKKFQRRLISAKKKLSELDQQHVFDGFRYGEKSQGDLLGNQLVSVNSKLLQLALGSITFSNENLLAGNLCISDLDSLLAGNLCISDLDSMQLENGVKLWEKCPRIATGKQSNAYSKLLEKGHDLRSLGKLAVILVLKGGKGGVTSSDEQPITSGRDDDSCLLVEELLGDSQLLVEVEERPAVPLVLISSALSADSLQQLFSSQEHFKFDSEKIWFFEEEKLPIVSTSSEEPKRHKILMKSPWEILQKPVGSGGIISLLSSNHLLDSLTQLGVEYIEVCDISTIRNNRLALLGLVSSSKANVGVQVFKNVRTLEEDNLNMIFSIDFMKKLTKQVNKLHLQAIPKLTTHVERVDKEWIDVVPCTPNSLEFHSSIYSCLYSSPLDKVSVLEVTD